MSFTFTKLFSSITESTVWMETSNIRIVWITMLAMADRKGRVWASVPGLANRSRVPVDDCRKAIETFLAPDADSRTKDNEGRRIEEIDGGWRLLNHEKYRAVRDDEAAKESKRNYINERRRKEREANKLASSGNGVEKSSTVEQGRNPLSVSASDSALSKDRKQTGVIPTAEQVTEYSASIGYPMNGQAWCDIYAQKGWMVGKNKMKDWQAAVRNWKTHQWKVGPEDSEPPRKLPPNVQKAFNDEAKRKAEQAGVPQENLPLG